ncbi:NAD(P)/FAD-dependent oxidoreductase [Mesobacillus selenatarsenatis]|uniref:D-amino acid dehydrogenase small subunit n=1 Tax=Mesobacillus selenatarsenatis (strain DSM 18680 / JCM 14380 / FERM P-15431 / SF-1) TaxID=1321606 RepID=A0A0A8X919_MESS1|nr:FAD-binding oxidoreductase [Mesobacillus selenatarsenatis]GAM15522.1 D-amino acid dehydrogenase small subunit [Mesobacillus selenatarsenatis SF-1]
MKKYVVIGAGILGASTAYHLAKEGKSVTIIDRGEPGQATDAAAGIICPWITQRRNKAWYFLAKNGAAFYPSLIKQLEDDGEMETGYQRVGALSLHHDREKLIKMEERATVRREDAPEIGEIRQLDPHETNELFPPLSEEYSSVHVSGGARVNGRLLRLALLNAAQKHGASLVEGDAQLECAGENVTGVYLRDTRYEADKIIITAGAWAPELLKPLGMNLSIAPQKAQIIHLKLEGSGTGSWPVVMPPNNQYILAFDGGRVVIGATHEDEMGFDSRPTLGGMHEIIDKGLTVAPGLADATYLETKVGFRPVAPNFLPIIGTVPGFDNLFMANGLGASGLTVGPYLGAQLAKLAAGEDVELDLEQYDVSGAISDNIS